jgi:hypothetical protein
MKKSKRANRPPMEDDEDFDSMPTKKGINREKQ